MNYYQNSIAILIGVCCILGILHAIHAIIDSKSRLPNIAITLICIWIGLDAGLYLYRIAITNQEFSTAIYFSQQAIKFTLPLVVFPLIQIIGPNTFKPVHLGKPFALLVLLSFGSWFFLFLTNVDSGTQVLKTLPWGEQYFQFKENTMTSMFSNGALLFGMLILFYAGIRNSEPMAKTIAVLYGLSISIDLAGRITGAWDIRVRWFGFALLPISMHSYLLWQQVRAIRLQKELEQERARLQIIATEQESILRAAVHDFRSPLASISGFSTEIRFAIATEQDRNEVPVFLDFIDKGVTRLQDLMQGLVSVLRTGQNEPKCVPIPNLEPQIQTLFSLSTKQLNEVNALFTIKTPHTVNADPIFLFQILQNLLENSLKYRDSSRNLELSLWTTESKETTELHFKDNGQGFKANDIAKAGTPFQRFDNAHSKPGMGIGLSICKKCMTQMNGALDIESLQGQGTDIILSFPR